MGKLYKILGTVAMIATLAVTTNAQSIRKNYREMTSAEKLVFCNALKALKTKALGATNVIDYYGNFHSVLGNSGIHNNERFTSWHRKFLQDFETELRNSGVTNADKISLPYWDWTSQYYTTAPTDAQTTSPLWGSDFMGQFNSLWGLGRNLGFGSLPTVTTMQNALANTTFGGSGSGFRYQLENYNHNGPHGWVGGIMGTYDSPKDPVFYLHHAMVDKIWQDWHNLGGVSTFPVNDLPGYPGLTSTAYIDSRGIKVWYAENHYVNLYNYTSSGTENYYYTETINAGGNGAFNVPSGVTCNLVSGGFQMAGASTAGSIVLKPGFLAASGSNFSAKINAVPFNTSRMDEVFVSDNSGSVNLSETEGLHTMVAFPNPSSGNFQVFLAGSNFSDNVYDVLDMQGSIIESGKFTLDNFALNLTGFEKGIYMLKVKLGNGEVLFDKLVIQ
jgi:tyrosinase